MDLSLQYIIQWLRSRAPKAKDPRLCLFSSLYKSSSIDPHTLKVKQIGSKLNIEATLLYTTPDLKLLKKTKEIRVERASKKLIIILEKPTIDSLVFLSHSRGLFDITLEEALILSIIYTIFNNVEKLKSFQQLIQGEQV